MTDGPTDEGGATCRRQTVPMDFSRHQYILIQSLEMTDSRSWGAAVVVTTLVVAGALGVVATPAAAQAGPGSMSADSIVVTIDVQENGTAVWTIQYRFRLDTTNETRGFERLRQRIAAERGSYVASVRGDAETTVHIAANQTGREMSVGNVSVGTWHQTMPTDVGIVENRFVWRGFAAVNDSHVVAGDAIRGFSVGARTQVTVSWPDGYRAAHLDPTPSEREGSEATWEDADFGGDEPRFAFARRSAGPPLHLVGAAGILLVVLGVAFVRRSAASAVPRPASLDGGRLAAAGWRQDAAGEPSSGGDAEGAADDAGEAGDGDAASDAEATTGDGEMPPGPMSNEEQVMWVLEAHDGRVKQQRLAEKCDWSDSKTSRVVRRLHEEDAIDLFRLGRENVVSLPEVDHDDA